MGRPNRFAGIFWILFATAAYSGMAAFTKVAILDVDVFAIVFWRSVIVVFIALASARLAKESIRPRHWGHLLLRSVFGLTAMVLYFWCLGQIPLGVGTTLLQTSPLFTVLLAGVLLGEKTRKITLPLTAVAFLGVVFIVDPTEGLTMSGQARLGILAGLASGLLAALAYMTVRKLRETDTASGIVFFFAIFGTVATAPLGLRDGLPDLWPTGACLAAVGLFAGLGQLAMTRAYRVEKAAIVSPLSYSQLVFSFTLGVVFFGEEIGPETIFGILLVICAGAFLTRQADAKPPQEEPSRPAP